MNPRKGQKGFTLVEVLVVMAIIAIIISATLMVGSAVESKAREKNTKGTIKLLVSALQEYQQYHHAGFPPAPYNFIGNPPPPYAWEFVNCFVPCWADFGLVAGDFTNAEETQEQRSSTWQDWDTLSIEDQREMYAARASAEVLYWYLNRVPDCREYLSKLPEEAVTNDDQDTVTVGTLTSPLLEVSDAWMHPLRYTNPGGGNFPIITSAGPDGLFDTADDIISTELL